MQPYPYLIKVMERLPAINDREEINKILDEVEFLYDALDPSLQELAEQVMEKLRQQLREVP